MKRLHNMAFPSGTRKNPVDQAFSDGFLFGLLASAGLVILFFAAYRIGALIFLGAQATERVKSSRGEDNE